MELKKCLMKRVLNVIVTLSILFTACNKDNEDDCACSSNQEYPSSAHVFHCAVTDIDGNTYDAVQIGSQVWMAENLHVSKYADGTPIPKGRLNVSEYCSSDEPYFYVTYNTEGFGYNYQPLYGYLYNWPAVMNGANNSNTNPSGVQGVCPNGWHVPSDAEWKQLEEYVKNNSQYHCDNCEECIAKALASTERWHHSSNNCAVGNDPGSNNATGFSAFPTGYYHPLFYGNDGDYAVLWSTTKVFEFDWGPLVFGISHDSTSVYRGEYYQAHESMGIPVRCVRD